MDGKASHHHGLQVIIAGAAGPTGADNLPPVQKEARQFRLNAGEYEVGRCGTGTKLAREVHETQNSSISGIRPVVEPKRGKL